MGQMGSTLGLRKLACLALPLLPFFLLLLPFSAARAEDMKSTVMVGSSRIDVTIDTSEAPISQPDVMKWVQNAADSVVAYYGRFPVPHLTLRIISFDGSGVRHGTTWGRGGGLIRISAGSKTSAAEFADDWMLTHEMIHLAFPSMADEHHWIEEGFSTYVEPIARIQAGQMTALQMWTDLARDMRKGVPDPEDKGLDHTHTWASTYWGGALFCFMADVRIREQTNNKKGLQDALRGILNAGGDIRYDWTVEDALKAGDQATGVPVLIGLYGKMKDQPMPVDLSAMWKQLGIDSDGMTVHLNDDAPLAAIRRAITSPETAKAMQSGRASPPSAVYAGRSARSSTRPGG